MVVGFLFFFKKAESWGAKNFLTIRSGSLFSTKLWRNFLMSFQTQKTPENKQNLKQKKTKHTMPPKKTIQKKVAKVMNEYKQGHLHSGSKHGPVVTNQKQAVAIAYSEARRKGKH